MKTTNRDRINTVRQWDFIPDVDDRMAVRLYDERILLLEILDVSIDMCYYLLVLSLRATKKIDEHLILAGNDSLLGYSRAAMQEMLVIRIRELFSAKKDDLEGFELHGFHKTLLELGVWYPMPNIKTNNIIARIIHRRRFYSAHHKDGKKDYSFTQNRLRAHDLITAMLYFSKVEESLRKTKDFDPFEILLNDELGRDGPLVWDGVYETVTGHPPYTLVGNDDINTLEFEAYLQKARQELRKVQIKIQSNLN